MSNLVLRAHQTTIIDKLRAGFAAGNRAQVLYGPCAFGKTEVAISLMHAAAIKGRRSAMVLDRRVLCTQTSARLMKYRIEHGVLMAGSPMFRPDQKIQVCTAQTLEKRESFPAVDLLIIDEAHCMRKETVEFIANNPQVKVIGLSGSPFTKGMGAVYSSVESAVTIDQLVEQGWLIRPRVFIAREIDMSGAKKVAGEWSANETTKRGIQITGDIVAEWVAKTHEIFGGPRKTIVFCSGVAHGEDLARKFGEAGYNFISISYRDDDDYKGEVLANFDKPDTDIHGIIATDILTKGFDQSDVMIGVSARPFSKSFSSHVQQIGRVMRTHPGKDQAIWLDHCIASGQRVLTHRGLVAIERILLSDKIWDGHEFVSHKGVVSRGKRPVIKYSGITATADHLVKTTDEGWCSLGYCAEKQKTIIATGIGREAVRERDGYISFGGLAWSKESKVYACAVRVHDMWVSLNNFFLEFRRRGNKRMQGLQSAEKSSRMAERSNCGDAGKMQEQEQRAMGKLWWKGNRVQVRFCDFLRSLDSREFGMLGCPEGYGTGSDRQQWPLRAGEYPMGVEKVEFEQPTEIKVRSFDAPVQDSSSRSSVCGRIYSSVSKLWNDVRRDSFQVFPAIAEAEREVWDILDCGPRNSFTCEGLLVHNSGNYLRFRNQWDDLCSNGVQELDDGAEKPAQEPTDKEKDAAKCPVCGSLWPAHSDKCAHCGHERVRKSAVVEVAGEMLELGAAKKKDEYSSEYKRMFYAQLLGYAEANGQKPGSAYYRYIEKFGVAPRMSKPDPIPPGADVVRWVRSRQIAYGKAMKRAERVAA